MGQEPRPGELKPSAHCWIKSNIPSFSDPQEAEAIMKAFFPEPDSEGELFVGSIKTVVGHTEGTAGLAGLMKACLALQNATVPRNLLFNSLNPELEPFTRNLHVPTTNQAWPQIPDGKPRRARLVEEWTRTRTLIIILLLTDFSYNTVSTALALGVPTLTVSLKLMQQRRLAQPLKYRQPHREHAVFQLYSLRYLIPHLSHSCSPPMNSWTRTKLSIYLTWRTI